MCAGITGGAIATSLIESCMPLPYFKTKSVEKKIRIPLSEFDKNDFLIVSPSDYNYDIAVIKESNDDFKSLVMQCTHAINFLTFNGNQFNCNLHGSTFSRTGEVGKGPAEKPLISLITKKYPEELVIYLL